MTKPKKWTSQEEQTLQSLLEAKTPIETIASTLGRTTAAVNLKRSRLGMHKDYSFSSEKMHLPKELPSLEETLKILAGALRAATKPGLSRLEIQRLQTIAILATKYNEKLPEYVHYREIEMRLNDMEPKYAKLLQEKTQNNETNRTYAQEPKPQGN